MHSVDYVTIKHICPIETERDTVQFRWLFYVQTSSYYWSYTSIVLLLKV
jgi:hypothetical protein